MCGIAGLLECDRRADLGRLKRMVGLLRHRGPDDEGAVLIDPEGGALALGGADTPAAVRVAPHRFAPGTGVAGGGTRHRVALGHRRLAIVDLSPAGHQPMSDAGGRRWITYNGEIYNHVELRAELTAAGVAFTGTSDTEVILAAYGRWGRDCLRRFNGMFAFALWDGERRELWCARDRFGVKPFYYQWDGRSFAFASEPKALVLTQARRIDVHLPAVADLLALDWVDHEPETFFAGVHQLPPGHFLVVGDHGLAVHGWWRLAPERRAAGDSVAWTREFVHLFTDAVRIRLRADVDVGSCLSGGLDSSAVVATATALRTRPLHAFTCAYDEGPAYDERRYVDAVTAATGAVAHLTVPDGGDFWTTFDRLALAQDEPTAGPGLYSQWRVMALAHAAGLRVLLDGQGGDETLAGYFRYLPLRLRDLAAAGDVGGAARLWGPAAARLGWTTVLALAVEPLVPRRLFAPLRRAFGQGKDRVLAPGLRRLAGERAGALRVPPGFPTAMARQQAFDLTRRLLPSLLRYEDRNSMAFSIETRLPFLDYRLVEFVLSLPDAERLDGATTKAILRRGLRDRLPAAVLARRDKMGFETPVDVWLRSRYAAEVRRRLLTPGPVHAWLDPARLALELDRYLLGGRDIGLQVWRWLSLEVWARRFVAADPRVVAPPAATYTHPGLHESYTQVMARLARERRGGR